MRFRGRDRSDGFTRRDPRGEAFRSRDLVSVLRGGLSPWLKTEGFKRLGSNNWVRSREDVHEIVAVQCRRSGWDPRAGNKFVVEFEQARTPTRATGFNRRRIWDLLDDVARREALNINTQVAQTLPPPDQRFLRALPEQVQDHYLSAFRPSRDTIESSDVWFTYYDETDAAVWAEFLLRKVELAWHLFVTGPPSSDGVRPGPPDDA